MKLMGIGDEAASTIDGQLQATQELGWNFIEPRGVEVPGFAKANLHDIPDPAFDIAVRKFEEAGIQPYCFGSTIMNWAKTVDTPYEVTLAEVRRAIPRMKRTGAKFIRIMSFKPADDAFRIPTKVFQRVREVTQMFLDEGLQPVHENCMNHGGMSWQHALELLDRCPGLKWLFDTANPIFNADRSKPRPWPKQDPWEFWEHVRDHVVHLHVKDARWNPARNDADYHWPGEGDGRVGDILSDAFARGYDEGISIEPHMVVVFHDTASPAGNEPALRRNFVEYGRRLERLIGALRPGMTTPTPPPPAKTG